MSMESATVFEFMVDKINLQQPLFVIGYRFIYVYGTNLKTRWFIIIADEPTINSPQFHVQRTCPDHCMEGYQGQQYVPD